jgi:GNAT superfamily N-acetyltransferase
MHPIDIARLEEGRRARAGLPFAAEVRGFARGGVALRSRPGSWINYGVGMGLDGPVDDAEAADTVAWYEAAGIEPRVELAPFVDGATLRAFGGAGLRLRDFSTVLWRRLDSTVRAEHGTPAGVELRVIDTRDDAAVGEYAWVVNRGFTPAQFDPSPEHLELSRRFVTAERVVAVGAYAAGKMIGGGAVDFDGDMASLVGLSVLEAWRGRGVQQALIAERCRIAAERGVGLVTVGSRPNAATERNALRMGFAVAYTKVILAKSGAGLTPLGG